MKTTLVTAAALVCLALSFVGAATAGQASSTQVDVFISTQGENAIQVPAKLWREDAFWSKERHVQFFIALCIGAMLAMIIYNLFVYQATKDPLHLSFSQMTTGVGLAIATTYQVTYEYLWPDWPWMLFKLMETLIQFKVIGQLSFDRMLHIHLCQSR